MSISTLLGEYIYACKHTSAGYYLNTIKYKLNIKQELLFFQFLMDTLQCGICTVFILLLLIYTYRYALTGK